MLLIFPQNMGLKLKFCEFGLILTLLLQLSVESSDVKRSRREVSEDQLCDGKAGELMNHISDCTKFYQCTADEEAVTMQCPNGLYWDQSISSCNFRDQVNCANDPCKVAGASVFQISCREYYPCHKRAGHSMCCPKGQSINVMTGQCQTDASCTVPCKECHEVLVIDFDGSEVQDYMGNYVENTGVTIVDGNGYFDGNSFLTIPRFLDAPLAPFFEVRMRYKADTDPIVGTQALLTNGDCGVSGEGSVEITIEETKTNYRMRNDNGGVTKIARRTSKQHRYNRLLYRYADGQFRARLSKANKPAKTKSSNGAIGKSNCALKIGQGSSFNNFKGYIDFIKIWRCDRR